MKSQINLNNTCIASNILIFKTSISKKRNVRMAGLLLITHFPIVDWSIDTDDVDNVLRIVPASDLVENDIISLLKAYDFYCEVLQD